MFKRSQKDVSDSSQHWYQDKYQHVLTQRNLLAIISIGALFVALMAVMTVLRLAPLKSVEPYLLQIDEMTGLTQKVNPVTQQQYAASEAVDRYFTATYLHMRESYNVTTLLYNYNAVRLMSATGVFREYRQQIDPNVQGSLASRLGNTGRRDVKVRSMAYITNPSDRQKKDQAPVRYKILQAHITTSDNLANQGDVDTQWLVTVTFQYDQLALNEAEQWINPLGYQVVSYQIQREFE